MRPSFPVRSILLAGLLPFAGASAQFGPTQQFFCESPRSVELADFDGDGAKDLLIASREGLGFYRNTDGLGAFADPVFLGTLETVACVADVDGDGAIDVLASREQNSGLFWFRNDGSGTFG
ncbi:MAG: VCBS repeat-containing protein, partial [Flavobacteriales bacterium]|nr:VCBS repeat-containing protein [Flavobacteriales bacterium]